MRWSPPEQNAQPPSFGARPVAGEQHDADARVLARVVERAVELVDRVRTEGVAHLRPVERDAGDPARYVVVVGDVGELVESLDLAPEGLVEQLGYRCHGFSLTIGPPAAGGNRLRW